MLTEQELSEEVATLTLSQITTIDKDINLSHRIFHRFSIGNADEMNMAKGNVCVNFASTKIAEMVYKQIYMAKWVFLALQRICNVSQ